MRTVIPKAVVLAYLMIALAQCAYAAPTGLNVMTTADVLGHNEVALEYQNDGVRLFGDDCSHWALLQLGLLDRVELGVDRCFDGEMGTFGNAKVLLQEEEETRPAVAVGVQNLADGESAQPYVVLAKDTAGARLYLGVIRLDGDIEIMAGVECGLSEPVTLMVDHVTGEESASGVGLGVDLTEGLSLCLSRVIAHSADGDDSWQVILGLASEAAF